MHGWQPRSVGRKNNQTWREMKAQCLFIGLVLLAILADVESKKGEYRNFQFFVFFYLSTVVLH